MAIEKIATENDLGGDADWVNIELPVLRIGVRVRFLETQEIMRLQYIPDLLGWQEMTAALFGPDEEARQSVDTGALSAEQYRWEAAVAHLAVMANAKTEDGEVFGSDLSPARCDDCGFAHPPSLWSFKKTLRLHSQDVDKIQAAATMPQTFGAVRSFLAGETASDSRQSVDSGK